MTPSELKEIQQDLRMAFVRITESAKALAEATEYLKEACNKVTKELEDE